VAGGAGTTTETTTEVITDYVPTTVTRTLTRTGTTTVTTDSGAGTGYGGNGSDGDESTICDTHDCIPSFYSGTGYIVQCNDGMWSHSGRLLPPRRREWTDLAVTPRPAGGVAGFRSPSWSPSLSR